MVRRRADSVRAGARRRRRAPAGLRERVAGVAERLVLAPVAGELARYREACAAFAAVRSG
ncbi:hypothetical protein LI90_3102 [Carbonactinospora thermoautotrophica]|uniref:Uncharacterized protein n=1 Tax=Carbonactinospora thermoautotrophica TaxID=1469144 RepID=A0A132MW75_9ACTN|nr:hypothetical protein LI90_3102 [Carbonactinospora thermoautotrophica]